ncbi:MAG: hypothetical protein QM820_44740 [Minicystis sp.]
MESVRMYVMRPTGPPSRFEIDALVEGLRDLHRPLRPEVQVARRVLLQLRGRVRRRRVALLLLARDLGDAVGRALQIGAHGRGLLAVGHLDLAAVGGGELGGERLAGRVLQRHADVPVLLGLEGADLALAVDDEAQGHRLHAAGREAEGELRPDQRGDVVAHDAIENAPGALGIVEVLVELPRVVDPVVDALLGDLVELDALDLELRALDLLGDVEGDGLALAIGVGREHDGVHLLRRCLELVEDLLLALDDRVRLREVVRDVDGFGALGQILDVSLGRQDLVPSPQVFLDGLRLGRRLHDHERLGHHHLLRGTLRTSNSILSAGRPPPPSG